MNQSKTSSAGCHLRPVRPIQRPILDRLRDVLALQLRIVFQIGNGPGDLQDAVVSAGAQALLLHGTLEHAFAVGIEFAVRPDLARSHLGI